MPSFLRLSAIYPHPANSLWLLIKHQFLSLISMVDLNIFQTSSSMLPYHVASPVLRYFIDPFVSFTELQFPTLAPPVKLPSFRVCFPVCQALPSLGSAPWPSSRREQQRFFFSHCVFKLTFSGRCQRSTSSCSLILGCKSLTEFSSRRLKGKSCSRLRPGYRLTAIWFFILPVGKALLLSSQICFLSFALVFCFKVRSEEEILLGEFCEFAR